MKAFNPLPAVFAHQHLDPFILKDLFKGKHIPHIVIDHQHLLPVQYRFLVVKHFEGLFLAIFQIVFQAVEKQGGFVEQLPVGIHPFDNSGSRMLVHNGHLLPG